jgi:hypothetical protein
MRGDDVRRRLTRRLWGPVAAPWPIVFVLALVLASTIVWSRTGIAPDVRAQETTTSAPAEPDLAGTPAAGTPVPVTVDSADEGGARSGRGGQAEASGEDASALDSAGSGEGKAKEKREPKEREPRDHSSNHRSNGNGGVANVVAPPPEYTVPVGYAMPEALRRLPVALYQQDASDATAGSVGENGTINGQPRETPEPAPAPVGPGNPGQVLLPPSVPGIATGGTGAGSPTLNPAVSAGISGTTELVLDAISDATVFTSAPGSPQSPESVNFLAIGGDQGAVSLISFEVSGVKDIDGTVLAARLTFNGAGEKGAPGGSVGVIQNWVVPDGITANGVPNSETAFDVHGAPSWFERVEPNGLTAVDVSGSVYGDGDITFVLPGQPDEMGSLYSLESGAAPQLILTVALPA